MKKLSLPNQKPGLRQDCISFIILNPPTKSNNNRLVHSNSSRHITQQTQIHTKSHIHVLFWKQIRFVRNRNTQTPSNRKTTIFDTRTEERTERDNRELRQVGIQ